MVNDREINPQHQPDTGNAENSGTDHRDQFNELSELSLLERMNAADQIGIPVQSVGNAVATGVAMDTDDAIDSTNEETDE